MIGRDHLSPAHPVLIFILGHTHRDDVTDDVITMECGRGLTCKLSPGGRDLRSRDRSRPIRIHVAELSFLYYSPNGISIRSSVLAQHMVVSNTHTRTDTQATEHR